MLHVALLEPEIPPNTGNVIRLAANTGAHLHLIEPLGFEMDDRRLRRAGLDYHELARVQVHASLDALLEALGDPPLYAVSTRGARIYTDVTFEEEDLLLFGPETRGLPRTLLDSLPPERLLRIPMRAGNRSLNLSNAVSVILYEAWRQRGFEGASS